MKKLFRAVCIIGGTLFLAGFVLLLMPTVSHHPRPQEAIAKLWIHETAKSALIHYRIDCGRFPTRAEGLDALILPPPGQSGWRGPYLKRAELPLDPWGRPYRYRAPTENTSARYKLWSDGRDTLTPEDDIVSKG